MTQRADQELVARGLASSRSAAARLIASGAVQRAGPAGTPVPVIKAAEPVDPNCRLEIVDNAEQRYVSRAGLKLEAALQAFGVDVTNSTVLDVGQSTGGFTDCLLARGAALVVGVDVGHDQLSPKLIHHPQVMACEGINARDFGQLKAALEKMNVEPQQFDLAVIDVSFISQRLVLTPLVRLLKANTPIVTLFKPQFEVGRSGVGKGGIVKDQNVAEASLQQFLSWLSANRLQLVQPPLLCPIRGAEGNQEYLVHLRIQDEHKL